MKTITLKIKLNENQERLFRIYKKDKRYRRDIDAARKLFHEGLWDFYGSNTGNPAFPEFESLNADKL